MSKQPRKQRKSIYNAPQHARSKLMSVHLSKDLREEHDRRSLPVRTGDTVKIMKGDFKGHEGKVEKVNLKTYKVYVEGANTQKPDGNPVLFPIDPSNLMIVELDLNDDKRMEIIERKG